jgi:hypothetical protein
MGDQLVYAQAVRTNQKAEKDDTILAAATTEQSVISKLYAQIPFTDSKVDEGAAADSRMIPQKVYIIPGQDWFLDEECFDYEPQNEHLISPVDPCGPIRGSKGFSMTDLDQDVSLKGVYDLGGIQKRTSCCLRALAFVQRATKTHEDALLLMTSIAKFSTGQVKMDSTSFCRKAAALFETKVRDWDVCAVVEIESQEQMKLTLNQAKGLVALQWLGKSASESICKNIWNRLMAGYVGGKHFQNDPCNGQNLCSNCSYNNEAGVQYCKICNWTIERTTPSGPDYKEIVCGLACCHILSELAIDQENGSSAEKNSVGLGQLKNVLVSYQQLYPYSSVGKLGRSGFRKQCSCVIQLILTLSNFGSHKLRKDDFPEEFFFLKSELKTVIEVIEDTELIGKFIFCLSILGEDRESAWIIKGLRFLYNVEGWFGNTGRWTDTDASILRHYQTSWSAAVAMIDPLCTYNGTPSHYVNVWLTVVIDSKSSASNQVISMIDINLKANKHIFKW